MMETTAATNMNGSHTGNHPEALRQGLEQLLKSQLEASAFDWLKEKAVLANTPAQLNLAFAAIPRKVGKGLVEAGDEELKALQRFRPGFTTRGWTLERLARVWLLLHLDPSDQASYTRAIEALFLTADMNEQVALYSALPLLAYPEYWQKRCAEGIRSNIGPVLEAIMCNNPYPSEQLDGAAWNQLVLKAFFTEKPVQQIIGLDKRANKELAYTISDFAHERWAAHRTIHPYIWRCVAPFVDERLFADIQRLAASERSEERIAAVLVCRHTAYPPAKELLNTHPGLSPLKDDADLTWNDLVG